MDFTKFMVFFKVDEDPELYELLAEAVSKQGKNFSVDDLLTIMANYTQSLSPQTTEVFRVINEEFCIRLSGEHNPASLELLLKPEVDLAKITNTLLDYRGMHENLKNGMVEYIADNLSSLTFETTSELAVVFSTKMDETYKGLFFKNTKDKFMKELRYLKDETMYKIIWALIKSETMTVSAESLEWNLVKDVISEKAVDISPKIMSDLLVLSTMEQVASEAENPRDLFSKVEN